ncbi:MAG: prolyl oligopeptidase family serine peptidase [Ferruginibacter sp.]
MKKNAFFCKYILLMIFVLLTRASASFAQQAADTASDDGTIKPLLQNRNEDYATVRSLFKTKLIKQGHAPSRIDSIASIPQGVTQIEFATVSGKETLNLKAWINMPFKHRNQKHPVVIFLHGGYAFEKEDWDMAKPFRDSGFIVVAPVLRAEDGQAGIFSMFYNEVDDIVSLAAYLRTLPYIDKNNMYISGHSVGGTVALLAAMSTNYFRKAVSLSASPDQAIYCKYGINPKFIPFDTSNIKEFEVRSPLCYAGSFKCPVRLYYGSNERHWRLSTMQTAAVAQSKGLDVQAFEVDGGHEDAVPIEMKLAIKFFKEK